MNDKMIERINKAVKTLHKKKDVISYANLAKESGLSYHQIYNNYSLPVKQTATDIILDLLNRQPYTIGDLTALTNYSRAAIYKVITDLSDAQKIVKSGSSWRVI